MATDLEENDLRYECLREGLSGMLDERNRLRQERDDMAALLAGLLSELSRSASDPGSDYRVSEQTVEFLRSRIESLGGVKTWRDREEMEVELALQRSALAEVVRRLGDYAWIAEKQGDTSLMETYRFCRFLFVNKRAGKSVLRFFQEREIDHLQTCGAFAALLGKIEEADESGELLATQEYSVSQAALTREGEHFPTLVSFLNLFPALLRHAPTLREALRRLGGIAGNLRDAGDTAVSLDDREAWAERGDAVSEVENLLHTLIEEAEAEPCL